MDCRRVRMGVLFLIFAMLGGVPRASAQIITSDISGTVTDPSGAVAPDTKVTILNPKTGLVLATMPDKDGLYRVHGLQPGTYEVRAEAPGFQTYSRQDVMVDVNQQLVINIQLTVGSSEQTVTVTEQVAQVETTTAQVSNLVSEKTLAQLPLNGRDLYSLTLLEPGVVPT